MLRLGAFDIQEQIGRGGMGVIYRALHRLRGVPVAIKVDLHPPTPEYTAAFLHEVQVVAGLDHENIVMVVDHGAVDENAAEQSRGILLPGSRWLAMELAGGGSVDDTKPADWEEVRAVFTGLLVALSHAHARGVIHRDIKPGNLLLAGPRSETASVPRGIRGARIVLSDFGISHQVQAVTELSEESVGTPLYMAPEQIEAAWRDQGPWTDLYAAGIMLWRLVTGEHPYKYKNKFQLFRAHLESPPQEFRPAMAVPEGLEGFIKQLIAKDPAARFAFASDAMREMLSLGSPVSTEAVAFPAQLADEDVTETQAFEPTQTSGRRALQVTADGSWVPTPLSAGARAGRNFQLEGAGLSLYGLRAVPVVGRVSQRDALWGELVRVRTDSRARMLMLRGPSGTGKSRLAAWLSYRAHEVGAGLTLKASHTEDRDPEHGLVRMLARHFHTDALEPGEVDERLDQLFPDAEFDLALMKHLLGGTGFASRKPGASEVRQLVARVLTELAGGRTLIVWLDDVQWGLGSLEWVDFFFAYQQFAPAPVLIVATVEDTALAERPDEAMLIDDLCDDPAVTSVELGPLSRTEHQELVRELLGLDGALAQSVEERTAGNPMFAVQLVGQWVERGILELTENGFRLLPGAKADLPDNVHAVWSRRVDAALAEHDDMDAEALELAAALGMDVVHEEWKAACALLELEPTQALFEDLLRRHLIRSTGESLERWQFAHGLLREALVRRSHARGHWLDHNLAAAVHVRESGVHAPQRLARYFLEAQVYDEAFEPLAEAASDQLDAGDFRSTALVDQLEGCLSSVQAPRDDKRWGRLWLLRTWQCRQRGAFDDAQRYATRTERAARRYGWDETLARALRGAGKTAFRQADYDGARDLLEEAEQAFTALGDSIRAADCRYTLGQILARGRDQQAARAMYQSCLEPFEHPDAWMFAHYPMLGMALSYNKEGNYEAMAPWLKRARQKALEHGFRQAVALAANLEGEAARAAGQLQLASELYRESARHYRAMANPESAVPMLNLGLVSLDRELYQQAVDSTKPLLDECERTNRPAFAAYSHMVLMTAHAGLGHFEEVLGHLRKLADFLKRTSTFDPDIAAECDRTARLCHERGDFKTEERALQLGIEQYEGLGRAERVAALRARLL